MIVAILIVLVISNFISKVFINRLLLMILFIFLIIPLLLYLLRVIFVRLLIIVHCRLLLFSLLLLLLPIIGTIHPPSLRIRSNLLITLLIRLVEILLLW
jgi:hypothetical protein